MTSTGVEPTESASYLSELWKRRELALVLAKSQLRARDASTSLGLLWSVGNPLLLGAVYLIVFAGILKTSRGEPKFLVYLLSGIFVFYYTRSAAQRGPGAILANARLITSVKFPRLLLPISTLIEALFEFGAALLAYVFIAIGFGLFTGLWVFGWSLWLLIPAVIIQTVFNLGLAALVARISISFRDMTNIIPYALRIWLYLSPIIWPLSFMEGLAPIQQLLIKLNPMYPMLDIYRSALTGSEMESWTWAAASGWAIGIAVVGIAVFLRAEPKMARYL